MADTLVLDTAGLPVQVMPWKDVMTLWSKDRIVVKESDPLRILRSPSFEMEMPVVVQLKNNFARRQRRTIPFSRRNVAIRDSSKCQYCGQTLHTREYTYDHIRPQSRGGKSNWKNLVLCCITCNMFKANRTPEEATGRFPLVPKHPFSGKMMQGMFLLHEPMRPDIHDTRFNFRLTIKKLKPQWKPWASWLYWNVPLDE
jgi:5-methylcytosine-specific restriction endonuclease McrA